MKKRALGKGLDALLSPMIDAGTDFNDQLRVLPIDMVKRGEFQPRIEMDSVALQELADSIKTQGVMQPIIVRFLKAKDHYEIIAGERRWRATQLAGLHEIPVVIKDVNDETAMCLALIENIQREDLNTIDEARALSRLVEEANMTHDAIAKAIGKSRAAVSNILRLLGLHVEVQKLLETGKIEMGHGRAILGLELVRQQDIANQIIKKRLSVRQTEHLVKRLKNTPNKQKEKTDTPMLANLKSLQDDLSEHLGASVAIRQKHKKGSGMLVISYNSLEELDGILHKIKQH